MNPEVIEIKRLGIRIAIVSEDDKMRNDKILGVFL